MQRKSLLFLGKVFLHECFVKLIHFSEDGKPLGKKALKKLREKEEKERKKAETAAKLAAEKAAREANAVVSIVQSQTLITIRTMQKITMESCLLTGRPMSKVDG